MTPAERAPHLDELAGAVEALAQMCNASPLLRRKLSAAERRTLRGRWASHLPQLALRLSQVLDREPEALAPLHLSGADLRAQETEARRLFAVKAVLDVLSERVADALLEGRGALCSDVSRTLEAIQALTEGPLARPETAERLRAAATPALALVGRQREKTRARRRQMKALRTGAEGPAAADRTEEGRGLTASGAERSLPSPEATEEGSSGGSSASGS